MAKKMENSNKRWTEMENNAIKYYIAKYGYALGCKKASIDIGRSVGAICSHYYYCNLQNSTNGNSRPSKYSNIDKKAIAKYLSKILTNNPLSIKNAIETTAMHFNISFHVLSQMYYGTGYYGDKTSPIYRNNMKSFYLVGSKSTMTNAKNPAISQNVNETKNQNWFFGLITKLLKLNK